MFLKDFRAEGEAFSDTDFEDALDILEDDTDPLITGLPPSCDRAHLNRLTTLIGAADDVDPAVSGWENLLDTLIDDVEKAIEETELLLNSTPSSPTSSPPPVIPASPYAGIERSVKNAAAGTNSAIGSCTTAVKDVAVQVGEVKTAIRDVNLTLSDLLPVFRGIRKRLLILTVIVLLGFVSLVYCLWAIKGAIERIPNTVRSVQVSPPAPPAPVATESTTPVLLVVTFSPPPPTIVTVAVPDTLEAPALRARVVGLQGENQRLLDERATTQRALDILKRDLEDRGFLKKE